jgi:ribosome-associated protein
MSQSKKNILTDPLQFAHCVIDAIAEKKGEDIVLMDLREHALFADYFVICSGASERQLNAIVEGISETAKKQFRLHAYHAEGDAQSGWILLDYTDVIIHIFAPRQRHFYNLEGLWKEAPVILQMQ